MQVVLVLGTWFKQLRLAVLLRLQRPHDDTGGLMVGTEKRTIAFTLWRKPARIRLPNGVAEKGVRSVDGCTDLLQVIAAK